MIERVLRLKKNKVTGFSVLINYMGVLTNYCGKVIIFEKLTLYFGLFI